MMDQLDKAKRKMADGYRAYACVWLAALWFIVIGTLFYVQLPSVTPAEKVVLMLGDVNSYYGIFGVSYLILIASGWFHRMCKSGTIAALLAWSKIVGCFAMGALLSIGYGVPQGNQWSPEIYEIVKSSESPAVWLPFAPVTSKLIREISPFEAAALQSCLVVTGFLIQGYITIALLLLLKNAGIVVGINLLMHIVGRYALGAWPSWISWIPQSYFFLQNYNRWSPLPTMYTRTLLHSALFQMLGIFALAALAGKLRNFFEERRMHE